MMTGRSEGGMSEISDSVLGTSRSFVFTKRAPKPEELMETIKPTRFKNAAACEIQTIVRGFLGRCKYKSILRSLPVVVEDETADEESVDHEYNAIVEENERLEEEKVAMTYELERLKRELLQTKQRETEAAAASSSGAQSRGKKIR